MLCIFAHAVFEVTKLTIHCLLQCILSPSRFPIPAIIIQYRITLSNKIRTLHTHHKSLQEIMTKRGGQFIIILNIQRHPHNRQPQTTTIHHKPRTTAQRVNASRIITGDLFSCFPYDLPACLLLFDWGLPGMSFPRNIFCVRCRQYHEWRNIHHHEQRHQHQ